MSNLLQALIAFVGVMLVLALAAQSVQEILKTMVVLKGRAQLKAMEGLIREATRFHGQFNIDADAIIADVKKRLAALGQKGVRKGKLRLDELGADNLKDLIASVSVSGIPGLQIAEEEAKKALEAIGERARTWYDLAVCPVDQKYRRQMRVLALAASAFVVIPLNAGAGRIFKMARTDPAFRARVDSMVAHLQAIPDTATVVVKRDSAAGGDSAAVVTTDTTRVAARNARAEAAHEMVRADSLGIFAPITGDDLSSIPWWVGILLSVLLVSLGAPFWHDLLESLFGLKNRIRAQAEQVREGGGRGR